MESLALTYAYRAYEIETGIEDNFPELQGLPNVLNLAYLAGLILLGQVSLIQGAIAHATLFQEPIQGAIVNTAGSCLNVRVTPKGDIFACVKKGAVLKPIVIEENGWYQLANGHWVDKDFVQLPTPANPPAAAPKAATWQDLKYVENQLMYSDKIKLLQTKLNYYKLLGEPLAVDGYFGQKTKLAVEAYQQQKGLVMDGIVGGKTRAALGL